MRVDEEGVVDELGSMRRGEKMHERVDEEGGVDELGLMGSTREYRLHYTGLVKRFSGQNIYISSIEG